MAIVTISRIQHRRGAYENLPQLAGAELGWAVDKRRLFIGNGTITEGAPEIGNTEILTEYSDLLSTVQNYIFQNPDAGYTPNTGSNANSPTIRTLQRKLDDFVTVKDFGAKGDGEHDDTEAINRALFELYCRTRPGGAPGVPQAFKTLYFPAGVYKVSNYIKVPPNARLIGDGPSSTVIQQNASLSTATAVMVTADSSQQTFGSLGTNGAYFPTDIMISDMGLICNCDGVYVNTCNRMTLHRIRITGPENFPTTPTSAVSTIVNPHTTPATGSIGVYITGTSTNPSTDINLEDCFLTQLNYGIWQNNSTEFFESVIINSTTFYGMYEGIVIGLLGGSAKNIVVTSSVFDAIFYSAIDVNNVDNFASSFNHYLDVAAGNEGANQPIAPVINFGLNCTQSASLGDLFDRNDPAAIEIWPCVSGTVNTSTIQYGKVFGIGYLAMENGKEEELEDNVTDGATSIVLPLIGTSPHTSGKYVHAIIDYSLQRYSECRSGTLNIALDGFNGYSIDDDSTETNDVGITFNISINGGNATVTYTSTSAGGSAATFRHSVRRLNDVV